MAGKGREEMSELYSAEQVAERLGLNRGTVIKRLQAHGLD